MSRIYKVFLILSVLSIVITLSHFFGEKSYVSSLETEGLDFGLTIDDRRTVYLTMANPVNSDWELVGKKIHLNTIGSSFELEGKRNEFQASNYDSLGYVFSNFKHLPLGQYTINFKITDGGDQVSVEGFFDLRQQ